MFVKFKKYIRIFLILPCLWLIGFVCFAVYALNLENDDATADVTVVLTGDTGRLSTAAKLLQQNKDHILFISGVGGGAELNALSGSDILNDEEKKRISIGRTAENTRENALETKDFLVGKKVHSMLLVTSYYHMPRSMVEFKRVFPDTQIKPYPVFTQKTSFRSFKLLMKEYNKFILAFTRATFFKITNLE